MKICPECHKLSRDDDFCSHCGAAVYPDNSYSGSDISCGNYREFDGGREHTHEKESYSRPYTPPPGQQSGGYNERPPVEGGRKSRMTGCIVLIIIFAVFFEIIDSFDIDFWEWLGSVLKGLFNDL